MTGPASTKLSTETASSTVRIKAMNGSVSPGRLSVTTWFVIIRNMTVRTTQTRLLTPAVTTIIFTTRLAVGPGAGRKSSSAKVNVLERRRRTNFGNVRIKLFLRLSVTALIEESRDVKLAGDVATEPALIPEISVTALNIVWMAATRVGRNFLAATYSPMKAV